MDIKKIVAESGLFDKVYYAKTYKDVRSSPVSSLEHYCKHGIHEDRKPNADFDPSWYREFYTDVKEANMLPFIHFIMAGKDENRFQNEAEKEEYEKLQNDGFDVEFYRNHHEDLKNAPEGFNFVLHYLRCGKYQGHLYKNKIIISKESVTVDKEISKKFKTAADAFDEGFYLKNNLDIADAEVDAFFHYSNYGWKEGRNPNDWFDSFYYLESYEDVKKSGMEPLEHYIVAGQHENRKTKEIKISNFKGSAKKDIPTIAFDNTKEGFVEYEEHAKLNTDIKTIAFYLPQFHPFPENDAWWGKGFTEWTNVTKAQPNFIGHYQPHLPIHNGFYDLRVPEIMIEQAKLARNYGIYGFNFYYYWFDGKILMHRPFEILLEHKEIDINFCITWANENWTRRWDGAENDILMGQNHCEEDSIKFIENLYKFFHDERYIRIDNKPVLIIYRADIIPDMKETVELWRRKAEEAGFDGLYLICSQTFGINSPEPYGFDAAMEFPPHTVSSGPINDEVTIVNEDYEGTIYDYEQVVQNACTKAEPNYKMFRTTMLSWDNTARKQNNSNTFYNFSLVKYKQWLSKTIFSVYENSKYANNEKFVFVNAWNEWAEGTHLEPDRKYGYGYLQATYDVLKNFDAKYNEIFNRETTQKKNDIAVVLHIHYTDLWEEIKQYLNNLDLFGFDLFVTLTNMENNIVENIVSDYPDANITLVENRGRDILPFIDTYKKIKNLDYKYVCKIHSKKSSYRDDGDNIRDELYGSLLGSQETIQKTIDCLEDENNYGLVIHKKYLIEHNEKNMTYDQEIVSDLSRLLGFNFKYSVFPAGSMFWFKPEALSGIEKIESKFFQPEEGLADGTVAHGVERLFCSIVENNNFKIKGNDE